MSYELEGSIKVIGETASFGAKGFTKRELVVTTSADRYPQDIKLEFVKEKTSLLDNFRVGQSVKVGFDIRGGEYNGRYFVNLTGWKIENADGSGGGGGDSGGRSSGGSRPAQSGGGGGRQGGGGGGGGYEQRDGGKAKGKFTEEDFNQEPRDEYPF
jgi:hypothetical protein